MPTLPLNACAIGGKKHWSPSQLAVTETYTTYALITALIVAQPFRFEKAVHARSVARPIRFIYNHPSAMDKPAFLARLALALSQALLPGVHQTLDLLLLIGVTAAG